MDRHFPLINECLRDGDPWLLEDVISEALELMTAEVVGERMFGW